MLNVKRNTRQVAKGLLISSISFIHFVSYTQRLERTKQGPCISGTVAPVRDIGGGPLTTEQTIKIILSHLNLIVPIVAVILVIIIAIVVVCVVRGARDHRKGNS